VLGVEGGRCSHPKIALLEDDNVREGFFEREHWR
jgi:hypothetical protein